MSRATSGFAISADRSAICFSSSAISVSMISESRGFLMTLTRLNASADADDANFLARLDPARDTVCFENGALPIDHPARAARAGTPVGRASDTATAGGSDFAAFQS